MLEQRLVVKGFDTSRYFQRLTSSRLL